MNDKSMEELRQQLCEMFETTEFVSDKVLKVSQELDLKILQWMKDKIDSDNRMERKEIEYTLKQR